MRPLVRRAVCIVINIANNIGLTKIAGSFIYASLV
jgi:hypothetical protein